MIGNTIRTNTSRRLPRLWPAETATLLYAAVSMLLLSFASGSPDGLLMPVSVRLLVLFVISFSLFLYSRFPGKFSLLIRQFSLLPFLAYWYGETDVMNNLFFQYLDPYIVYFEETVFGSQPSLVFSEILSLRWLAELFYFSYFSFYILIFLLCLTVVIFRPSEFNRVLFVLLASFYTFYVIFSFLPSMGPYYWYGIQPEEMPSGYFFETAVKWAQDAGDRPTGAFPSSHVGITLVILLLSAKHIRPIFWFFLPAGVILMISTVYIKAHYALDVVSGIAAGCVFYFIYDKVFSVFCRRSAVADVRDTGDVLNAS
jgi:membrane-associated phospholipid phosphatase